MGKDRVLRGSEEGNNSIVSHLVYSSSDLVTNLEEAVGVDAPRQQQSPSTPKCVATPWWPIVILLANSFPIHPVYTSVYTYLETRLRLDRCCTCNRISL